MWKSMFYKEWIKIRLVFWLSVIVGVGVTLAMYMIIRSELADTPVNHYLWKIMNRDFVFFTLFKFLPLGIGLLIGLAQFIPEMTEKRIKLTLHLPINEEKAGLQMVAFGVMSLTIIFSLMFLVFIGIGRYYFPYEIIRVAAITVAPWFMSGFAAFFIAGMVAIEPIWKYRIAYLVIGGLFIKMFFILWKAGSYIYANGFFLILVVLFSISILFSIYRFRKGEM
ncbi:hypothetical protein D1164_07890 [Mariniphaga sediminis]|uniref:ABC transporter permease n=1 Tax=Mariniphaga sediminis TaxID=1628158 RepID=A0A399D4C0_9BACT|nr:hypothetical protein [Mariniphaga sediminis]RIH65581.1 hypothetical protein D1164_07890 [Mariniphaga sediminis]